MIKIERDNKKVEVSNGSLALIFLIVSVITGCIITIVALLNTQLTPSDWKVSLIVAIVCFTIFGTFWHLFRVFKEKIESGTSFAKQIKGLKGDIARIKEILEKTEE